MASLMGSLYIGVSGLQTSQNALNTTAHNMTNADTKGYVRQQVQLGTRFYNTIAVTPKAVANQQLGLGVEYSKVKQVRDYFLDQTYRRETGRQAFYEVSATAMEEVENFLDELNGESFQLSLENLWTAVQELSKDPSSAVTQGLLVQRSAQFLERAQSVYQGLVDYQNNLNNQIKGQVDKINNYAKQILELNKQIVKIEAGGQEEANDLRDARNQILDELSSIARISYSEDIMGYVSIQLEGVDLVKGEMAYEIGLYTDKTTGFHTPFWLQNATWTLNDKGKKEYNITGAEVFDLDAVISSDLNTDIGSLKATLLARGDHHADYRDVMEDRYSNSISQSVIMNVQAEFDQLVHNICIAMNKVIADAADEASLKNPDSTYLREGEGLREDVPFPVTLYKDTVFGEPSVPLSVGTSSHEDWLQWQQAQPGNAGLLPWQLLGDDSVSSLKVEPGYKVTLYDVWDPVTKTPSVPMLTITEGITTLWGIDGGIFNDRASAVVVEKIGGSKPLQIFQKIGSDGYTWDEGTGKWVYNEENPEDAKSIYSIANLVVNPKLLQEPTMLDFTKIDDSVDYVTTMENLKNIFTEESNVLNPNVKKKTSFVNYYGDLVAQVANSGKVYKSILINQEATVNATFSAREQVIGVSSDDELTSMVKFQNAYNASSRYINAINEMLAHIINTLAV
ncbi:MAG: flagellar hook-associated protein FlgK [Lachnospiraceae bacterium]